MFIYPLICNGLYSDSNERRFLYFTTIAVNSNINPLSQGGVDGDSLNQLSYIIFNLYSTIINVVSYLF